MNRDSRLQLTSIAISMILASSGCNTRLATSAAPLCARFRLGVA